MKPLFKKPIWLKLIAIGTMVIDHVGAILLPQVWWLRLIGRISFPIFSYLLVIGFDRTSNKTSYAVRLAGFALVSQYFYQLALNTSTSLNIFATLLISFLLLWILTTKNVPKILQIGLTLYFTVISFLLPLEYGVLGIIFTVSWYFLRKYKFWLVVSQVFIWTLYCLINVSVAYLTGSSIDQRLAFIQIAAPLALVVIYIINRIKLNENAWQISTLANKFIQYGFYLFYPLHLYIIHLISV
jgi:hypothetical protein